MLNKRAARCFCSPASSTHANVYKNSGPNQKDVIRHTQSMFISWNYPLDNESQMQQLRKNRGRTTHFGMKKTILYGKQDSRSDEWSAALRIFLFSYLSLRSFLQPADRKRTYNDINNDNELCHINIHLPCEIIWFIQGSWSNIPGAVWGQREDGDEGWGVGGMQGGVIKMNRASSMKETLSRCSSACLKKAWGSGS